MREKIQILNIENIFLEIDSLNTKHIYMMYKKPRKVNIYSRIIGFWIFFEKNAPAQKTNNVFMINTTREYLIDLRLVSRRWFAIMFKRQTKKRDNDYLDIISREKYKIYSDKKDSKVIIRKEAFSEHEAILSRILRTAVLDIKGNLYNIEKVHIYDLIFLQKSGTGKKITLPGDLEGINNYGNMEIRLNRNIKADADKKVHNLVNKENYIEEFGINVCMRTVAKDSRVSFKDNENIKYFDLDKIKGDISIRTRENGDKFVPFGMKGSKKLKDLFIDLKIPQEERDRIPLVCFNDDIAWVVGYRISDSYKVDKDTKAMLEITIKKI
jgi:tRNA(Ile)-lysidine synthase